MIKQLGTVCQFFDPNIKLPLYEKIPWAILLQLSVSMLSHKILAISQPHLYIQTIPRFEILWETNYETYLHITVDISDKL